MVIKHKVKDLTETLVEKVKEFYKNFPEGDELFLEKEYDDVYVELRNNLNSNEIPYYEGEIDAYKQMIEISAEAVDDSEFEERVIYLLECSSEAYENLNKEIECDDDNYLLKNANGFMNALCEEVGKNIEEYI